MYNIDLKLQILKDRGENFSEDLQSEIEERRAELENQGHRGRKEVM